MNAAAIEVVKQFTDIVVAYGQSDEYSFVLHEDCHLFERRAAKLATSISTAFSVEYCMQWDKYFPEQTLDRPFPTFDGRCVLYPKKKILRDYLSWRQADCESLYFRILRWTLTDKVR
jgi:tRNA(His) guanylyltransferase